MRNLMLFLFVVLLGINGLLLWQNRGEINDSSKTCCVFPVSMDIQITDVKKSLFPGFLGLVQ